MKLLLRMYDNSYFLVIETIDRNPKYTARYTYNKGVYIEDKTRKIPTKQPEFLLNAEVNKEGTITSNGEVIGYFSRNGILQIVVTL